MPDYDALRGETGGLPPDGLHDAWLDRAALVDTRNGEMLVTEWRSTGDPLYMWSTWFGFEGQRLSFTLDFLDSLGIDRSGLADVNGKRLEDALDDRLGTVYAVRTAQWGNGGGVNVTIEDSAQQTLDVAASEVTEDLPVDAPGDPVEVGAGTDPDDDDIPF